jgi:folate-binding protein YgfZ
LSETAEQTAAVAIRLSPLNDLHLKLGATMSVRDGWSVPSSYGDVLGEYTAVREGGCGLSDLSCRGRLLVTGSEAVLFLNGLITNDMKTLAAGQWMPAAFPNVQGRLLASVRVIHQSHTIDGDAGFLIDTEPATHEQVLKTISRFTLAGDFHVSDVTEQTAQLSIRGKQSSHIIGRVLGQGVVAIGPGAAAPVRWQDDTITSIRGSHSGTKGFDLFCSAAGAVELWTALSEAGARPVGLAALEILRIEAGEPRYGIDMDETNVVSETNLDDAISFTKGCYIGQEIIARIKYRGHVAKKLTGIMFDEPASIDSGATIKTLDGKEIGRLTSVAVSPHLGRTIALGYVKYDYLAPGIMVKVIAGETELDAKVTALPFVPVFAAVGDVEAK